MAPTAVALLAAFDPLTEGIRNLHDSGNPANMRTPLATLAALLDRLGRYEPEARIAGFTLGGDARLSRAERLRSPSQEKLSHLRRRTCRDMNRLVIA
jgi:hypothetical protein